MIYRKPTVYIPPYDYCDRVCERCAIDKSRCLLYQTEMDERLHRQIDGLGEPTPAETVERIGKDLQLAMHLVEEQAKEMGVDLDAVEEEPVPSPRDTDPIVDAARAVTVAIAGFLRKHGRDFPGEALALRRVMTLPGPKLARATQEGDHDIEVADRILQAQVAHRALGELAGALESARRREPSLGDELLDLLATMKALRGEIERRWLSQPCAILMPIAGPEWWGPLRDVTATLRHLRR